MELPFNISKDLNYSKLLPLKDITVENIWRIYAHLTFSGVEVSSIQYQETKKAFFAGFIESFKVLTDISTNLEEDEASDFLDGLQKEATKWVREELARYKKENPR